MMVGVAVLFDLAQLFFTFLGFALALGIGGTAFAFVKEVVPVPGLDVALASLVAGILAFFSGAVAVPALTPLGMVISSLITALGMLVFWLWFMLEGVRMGDVNNPRKYITMLLGPAIDAVPLLGALLPTLSLIVWLTIFFENAERKRQRTEGVE